MQSRFLCLRTAGRVSRFPLGLAIALLACGCGSQRTPSVRTDLLPYTPEEQARIAAARSARYRLQVGDVLTIDFRYEDSLDQKGIVILPDGFVSVSGMDQVHAAGMTLAELDSAITATVAKDYRNPDLTIIVQELGVSKVYVLGEVTNPGLHPLPPQGAGVLQAIAIAGGFNNEASTSEAVILRVSDNGYLCMRVDLSHLEKSSPAVVGAGLLQPYDVIYVPQSSMGDFVAFSRTFLEPVTHLSNLFWDVYAISNLNKIERIVR